MKQGLDFSADFLKDLGILDWGYTEESEPRSYTKFQKWVDDRFHLPLNYLSDERKNQRADLKNVFPEFKSALVFLFSYQEAKKWMLENGHNEIASYALGFQGEDYHFALKRKLEAITVHLKQTRPDLETFISLDVQPILERDLAHRAGLGWFGKNSMLINQKAGSYFIIGSLLLDQKLNLLQDKIDLDHCGQCMACVEACPTKAINPETRTLIADKCISTFTIEVFKEAEPPDGFFDSRGEFFGCDICQDVCPWNNKPLQRITASLKLQEKFRFIMDFFEMPKEKIKAMILTHSNRSWKKRLQGTALDRPGKIGWLKNLR